jgi:hypothetical protein
MNLSKKPGVTLGAREGQAVPASDKITAVLLISWQRADEFTPIFRGVLVPVALLSYYVFLCCQFCVMMSVTISA